MTQLGRPPVMLDIVEEHFEELDFLWELREGVIFAPDWNLEDLAEFEERAEAHLDGLRLAEAHAVDIARPHLMGEETFAATAATFVLTETGVPELAAEVVKALETAEDEARDGIRIGLRHSRIDAVSDVLKRLATSGDPGPSAAAADVLAFHRHSLPDIGRLLSCEDPHVRVLAHQAMGRMGLARDESELLAALRSDAPELQRAALEAAARSGLPGLALICRGAAPRGGELNAQALTFLGVLGDPADFELLTTALDQPELARAAIHGLGALGRLEAVPLLIQLMEHAELGVDAGAAFIRITGAEDIEAEKPPPLPSEELDVEEEFADETVPPDPARAQAYWDVHSCHFDPGQRWQGGQEVGQDPLGATFNQLPLEARRDVYLGCRARVSGLPDIELERPAALQ